jgi:hypothetical protein
LCSLHVEIVPNKQNSCKLPVGVQTRCTSTFDTVYSLLSILIRFNIQHQCNLQHLLKYNSITVQLDQELVGSLLPRLFLISSSWGLDRKGMADCISSTRTTRRLACRPSSDRYPSAQSAQHSVVFLESLHPSQSISRTSLSVHYSLHHSKP